VSNLRVSHDDWPRRLR